jgi:hypothetical protein
MSLSKMAVPVGVSAVHRISADHLPRLQVQAGQQPWMLKLFWRHLVVVFFNGKSLMHYTGWCILERLYRSGLQDSPSLLFSSELSPGQVWH